MKAGSRHVLVAGAGGIGCPATWGLAASGVGRITVLDPDVVELSNLPRQVWYRREDIGRPKAHVAAARLPAVGFVGGEHARLDDTNEEALLAGVDVVIDATDGAHAKDWLNQWAVRRSVPLVHAAGLRSEARLLRVPAGGKPCLACLFGRLTEETGSCADLGVWNGVVGTVGFLAAHAATAEPVQGAGGYAVLDFESGRAMTLGARAAGGCPVCSEPGAVEAYPAAPECAVPAAPTADLPLEGGDEHLDLREERCPLNLLRARKALATLPAGRTLAIALGAEGAATVPDGVRALGHRILVSRPRGDGLDLLVESSGTGDAERLDGDALQRFARQIVLPEVGEAGQRRLGAASVRLLGLGPCVESARTYLLAAGVGRVTAADEPVDLVAWAGGAPRPDGLRVDVGLQRTPDGCLATLDPDAPLGLYDAAPAVALAWGTLLADLVERRIVLGDDAPERTFTVTDGGGVA